MDAIKEKIAKLLAVAQGNANEHESDEAMRLASALMMKHGIDAADIDMGARGSRVGESDAVKFDHMWHRLVARCAAYLYGTQSMWTKTTITFVGRLDNREASLVTHHWLVEQVEAAYKSCLPKGMSKAARAEYRRTFKMACALRLLQRAHKLVAEIQENAPTIVGSTALVVVNHRKELEEEVDAFFKERKVRTVKTRINLKATLGAAHGVEAAEGIQLQKKVR